MKCAQRRQYLIIAVIRPARHAAPSTPDLSGHFSCRSAFRSVILFEHGDNVDGQPRRVSHADIITCLTPLRRRASAARKAREKF